MTSTRLSRRRAIGGLMGLVATTSLIAACQQAAPATAPAQQSAPKPTSAAAATPATKADATQPVAAAATPATSQAPVELLWYQYNLWSGRTGTEPDGKPEDYQQWQAEEFQKLYPNVTIKAYNFPQDIGAKIDGSIAAGRPVHTTFTQGQGIARYGLLGALSPVDDHINPDDLADYLPGSYEEMELAGKHYGYPYRLSPGGGTLINVDLFKEYGVDDLLPGGANPTSPEGRTWTVDSFLEAAKATTVSTSGSGQPDVYGTVLMGTEYTYQLNAFLLSYGAKFWNDDFTKVALNDDVGAEALQWLADLELTHRVAAPGTAGRGMQAALTFFQEGKAAILPISIGSHWKLLDNQAKNGQWANAFELWGALPPHKPPAKPVVQTNVYGYVAFRQKNQEEEIWAHKLAQFLSDREHSLLATKNGYPPVRKSLLEYVESDFIMSVATEVGTTHYHTFGKLAQTASPDPQLFQAVFSGSQTVKQALAEYEERATKKLEEAYRLVDEAKKRGTY